MITIGRLAGYAGVTIRAVRHYHRVGLLDEPPRDTSGYRRYSAADALALVKIRTLAEAGVPLASIKSLLAADPEQFTAALVHIDQTLQKRVEDIQRTRGRLAQLHTGDHLFLSPDVAGYLDRLRGLGVSPRAVDMERDGWILMQSAAPDQATAWIQDKLDAIADPDFAAIYLDYDAAFDWSADDPRLPELAQRTARWLTGRRNRSTGGPVRVPDPEIAGLVATMTTPASPAWDRLAELASQRRSHGAVTGMKEPTDSA